MQYIFVDDNGRREKENKIIRGRNWGISGMEYLINNHRRGKGNEM